MFPSHTCILAPPPEIDSLSYTWSPSRRGRHGLTRSVVQYVPRQQRTAWLTRPASFALQSSRYRLTTWTMLVSTHDVVCSPWGFSPPILNPRCLSSQYKNLKSDHINWERKVYAFFLGVHLLTGVQPSLKYASVVRSPILCLRGGRSARHGPAFESREVAIAEAHIYGDEWSRHQFHIRNWPRPSCLATLLFLQTYSHLWTLSQTFWAYARNHTGGARVSST